MKKKKIAAGILTVILGITGIPFPVAAQTVSSAGNIRGTAAQSSDPLKAIKTQDAVMAQQEEQEEEENMPAQEPDPLVLDSDGSAVPASTASWTEEPGEEKPAQNSGENDLQESDEDIFSDGNTDGTVSDAVSSEEDVMTAEASPSEETLQDDSGLQEEVNGEISDGNSDGIQESGNSDPRELQQGEAGSGAESDTAGNPEDGAEEQTGSSEELMQEPEQKMEPSAQAAEPLQEESASEETEDFSDGNASEAELGTVYQVATLDVKNGDDITAPLNTLFLELKDKATEENPYKIIIPPGQYQLTGTLCMYSNMYLYARGARITKTSVNKHILLRLGNTLESEGGYEGYRNIIIDGGTWDFNYQIVKGKDEPGGFVGFCIGHATNVTVRNATFLNNLKSHFLEFGGVKNAKITGCTFHGYYKNYTGGGQECIQIDCCTDESNVFPQYKPYDGSTCEDFVIDGNVFEDVFAGLGTHSMMAGKTYKRITVTNNTFHNVKKRCIEFLNYEDSTAENNTMVNVGTGVDVSAVNLKNTHKTGGYNGGPDTKTDRNIRVAGNYISLAKTSSIGSVSWVCSGIRIQGYNMKASGGVIPKSIYPVKGITVEDNQISGYGNGIRMTLADAGGLSDNQIRVKKTSAYSNVGISAEDSRGTLISRNTVSGTANAGIYIYDEVFGKNSGKKNSISGNAVSSTGGDGICLQYMAAASTAEKNTVKTAGGSGIHINYGKNVSVVSNSSSSNKNHGIKIEYTTGGIRARNNKVSSNIKSGILIWKAKASEISGNAADKNTGNGIYAYSSVISAMKSNTFTGNGKAQAMYVKDCKGFAAVSRPSFGKITAQSTSVSGTTSGGQNVEIYMQKSGKLTKLGAAPVNKKKKFTVRIRKQKKNTALRIISKDKYGNAVTVSYTVK